MMRARTVSTQRAGDATKFDTETRAYKKSFNSIPYKKW
jgi:hypothetical protein